MVDFRFSASVRCGRFTEEGVAFRSTIDGSEHFISPERSIEIQNALGADIIMAFDECPALPNDYVYLKNSMEMTLRWAERCREVHRNPNQLLFGIVQGGMERDLRHASVEGTVSIGFPGYAIGGLSVGEEKDLMYETLAYTAPLLPVEKPRYLMGVGTPEDLVYGVRCGVDNVRLRNADPETPATVPCLQRQVSSGSVTRSTAVILVRWIQNVPVIRVKISRGRISGTCMSKMRFWVHNYIPCTTYIFMSV